MKFPTYKKQIKSNFKFYKKEPNDKNYYRNVYLLSDHWKDLKFKKLEQISICEKCGTSLSLDIHHIEYKNLYDVKLSDLQVLCRRCHDHIHKKIKKKIKKKRNKKKNNYQKLKHYNKCNNFRWSKNPLIKYYVIMYIINRIIKRYYKEKNYAFNVKKSSGWENVNLKLSTNLYARSKIYNEDFKNLI